MVTRQTGILLDVGRKRGVTVQRGEGDHSYTDVVIMEEKQFIQYILKEVGMEDQMLRQLVMSNPESDTKDLLEEKRELNNKSVRGCIEI